MTDARERVARAIYESQTNSLSWDVFMSWAKGSPADCPPGSIGARTSQSEYDDARLLILTRRRCKSCGHEWESEAPKGSPPSPCPKCKSDDTQSGPDKEVGR